MAQKTEQQKKCESGYYFGDWRPKPEKRRITGASKWSPCRVGEIVTVKRWGTFGCWDTKNRWVDFYHSEPVVGKLNKFYLLTWRMWAGIVWLLTGIKLKRVK